MRALVVSDVCFYREGIARALEDEGIATEGVDRGDPRLSEVCERADVVLVDLQDEQFRATVASIAGRVPIVGLGLTRTPPVAAAVALGVKAFVGCDQPLSALVQTARAAARGEAVCPTSIAAVLFAGLGLGASTGTNAREALTRREREIGQLVVQGLSNKEIATALVIEPATVKNHVHQILRKLDVRRRGQVADLLRDA